MGGVDENVSDNKITVCIHDLDACCCVSGYLPVLDDVRCLKCSVSIRDSILRSEAGVSYYQDWWVCEGLGSARAGTG